MSEKVTDIKDQQPITTTRRELSDEAKDFINAASLNIIKDSIDPEQYGSFLCSISVNVNSETKEFDCATINLYPAPSTSAAMVGVYQVVLDLENRKVLTSGNFVSPIVMRKDKNDNVVDAVLLSRMGDISITSASFVNTIIEVQHDDTDTTESDRNPEVEKVDGEVVE